MTPTPDHFFDLTHYVWRDLFAGTQYVWEALRNIERIKVSFGTIRGTVSPQAYLVNPEQIFIDEGTVVEPGAYIQGPCIIGKHCQIRHGAYIRSHVIAGEGCVIGHATEIKSSILLDRAHAAHFNYVGDSILGNQTNLGAGTILANLRLDNRPITVRFEGKKHPTGLRKLGAILGDESQLGCNSVTNPGTLLPRKSLILPCTNR